MATVGVLSARWSRRSSSCGRWPRIATATPPPCAARAAELLDDRPTDDHGLAPAAEWVLGLALHELGEPAAAVPRHLRRAARWRATAGDAQTEALARAEHGHLAAQPGDGRRPQREIAPGRRAGAPVGPRPGRLAAAAGPPADRASSTPRSPPTAGPLPRLRRDGDEPTSPGRSSTGARSARLPGRRSRRRSPTSRESKRWPRGSSCRCWWPWPPTTSASRSAAGATVPGALAAFDRAEAAYASRATRPGWWRCWRRTAARCCCRSAWPTTPAAAAERRGRRAGRRRRRRPPGRGPPAARPGLPGRGRPRAAGVGGRGRRAAAFRSARRAPWAALAGYVGMQAEIRAPEDDAVPPPAAARPHPAARPPPRGAGLAHRGAARPHVRRPGRPGPRPARGGRGGAGRGGRGPGPRAGGAAGPGVARHRAAPPGRRRPRRGQAGPAAGAGGGRRLPGGARRHRAAGRRRGPRRATWPASACAWRWPTAGPRRCSAGPSAGGRARCACRRSRRRRTRPSRPRSSDLREARPTCARPTLEGGRSPGAGDASPASRGRCATARCRRLGRDGRGRRPLDRPALRERAGATPAWSSTSTSRAACTR